MDELELRGRLLARLREHRLLSRSALAKRAGVNLTTISHAEEGKTRLRLSTLEKIANVLDVDPLILLHPEVEDIPPKDLAAPKPESSPEAGVEERPASEGADPGVLSGWERQALTDPAFVVEFEEAKGSERTAYALLQRYIRRGDDLRKHLAQLRERGAPEDAIREARRDLSMANARATAASAVWGRLVDPGLEVAGLSPVEAVSEVKAGQRAFFASDTFIPRREAHGEAS